MATLAQKYRSRSSWENSLALMLRSPIQSSHRREIVAVGRKRTNEETFAACVDSHPLIFVHFTRRRNPVAIFRLHKSHVEWRVSEDYFYFIF